MRSKGTQGIHIYTLNLEASAVAIIQGLGLCSGDASARRLPWRPSTSSDHRRTSESVRPIFWANRPRSFLARTADWGDLQSDGGRWGSSGSECSRRPREYGGLNDPCLARLDRGSRDAEGCRRLWGAPTTVGHIHTVFVRFCKGEINRLPWSEAPDLAAESRLISGQLQALNEAGILTINRQPAV
eukprot:COSAG01_NODE_34151_length_552_cov_1.022075_1_plen_184_part_11